MDYVYNKLCDAGRLTKEIQSSAITIVLGYITVFGPDTTCTFKANLSLDEENILSVLVTNHVATPLPPVPPTVEVSKMPSNSPFAAKTLDGKALFLRVHGVKSAVVVGVNTIDFLIPYNNIKIDGVELIGGSIGDTCDLEILDTPTGTISTIPYYKLNQFGFSVNVSPNYYRRDSRYDADLIKDLTVRVKYTAVTAGTIGFNYFIHEVKP